DPGADHVTRRTMSIDVVRAVLGIILDDEDRGVFPNRTLAYRLDQLPDGVVVISNFSLWREFAGSEALCVIVVEPHGHKGRDRVPTRIFKKHFLEFAFPLREAAGHIVFPILGPQV